MGRLSDGLQRSNDYSGGDYYSEEDNIGMDVEATKTKEGAPVQGGGGSGSTGKQLGTMLFSAGMHTGEPTTMAAGATLAVISGISEKRAQERKDKANAENARRSRLMTAMTGLGQGVGSTGMA